MLDLSVHSEDFSDADQAAAGVCVATPSVDAVRAKLSARAAMLRCEARFAICGKKEQLSELASLLDDSARLLTKLSPATR